VKSAVVWRLAKPSDPPLVSSKNKFLGSQIKTLGRVPYFSPLANIASFHIELSKQPLYDYVDQRK